MRRTGFASEVLRVRSASIRSRRGGGSGSKRSGPRPRAARTRCSAGRPWWGSVASHDPSTARTDTASPASSPGSAPGASFVPHPKMAVEGEGRARDRQHEIRLVRGHLHPYPVESGRRHLARERALADQVVELRRIPVETAPQRLRRTRELRRADRLMGLPDIACAHTHTTCITTRSERR